nr:DUF2283 domain-containing protein [Mobiluncus sp. Marseille-Q7826]
MENEVSLDVDLSINAAYLRLSNSVVARTEKLSESMLIDLDSLGVVVGLELLDFNESIPVDKLIREFHVRSEFVENLARIQPTLNSYLARYTVGTDATVTVPKDTRDLITA